MAERLTEITARIESLSELQEIVGALRSLAAVRMQQAVDALPGIRNYAESIDGALAQSVPLADPSAEIGAAAFAEPLAGTGVLAFTSEHGFVGGYNERILEHAIAACGENGSLMVIGSRGAVLAEEMGHPAAWFHTMATHEAGVIEVARAAADELYHRIGSREISTWKVVYGRSTPSGGWRVHDRILLPFDPQPYRSGAAGLQKPVIHLRPDMLIERLVDEFVFSELMHAAMEAFASVNSARYQCMESAHGNIEKKLEGLSQKKNTQRQEEITAELLDIVTGVEAARAH